MQFGDAGPAERGRELIDFVRRRGHNDMMDARMSIKKADGSSQKRFAVEKSELLTLPPYPLAAPGRRHKHSYS
jgi:hypothetical protein